MYASSECYFGLNLRPMCDPSEVSYTLMPNMCYFEFLPMDAAASDGGDVSQLVYLARVEVGASTSSRSWGSTTPRRSFGS